MKVICLFCDAIFLHLFKQGLRLRLDEIKRQYVMVLLKKAITLHILEGGGGLLCLVMVRFHPKVILNTFIKMVLFPYSSNKIAPLCEFHNSHKSWKKETQFGDFS